VTVNHTRQGCGGGVIYFKFSPESDFFAKKDKKGSAFINKIGENSGRT
jgi:hypothetical protein